MAADSVTSQILFDGTRRTVMKFTNLGGGDGESAVTKVDVSALKNSPSKVKIMGVWYNVVGMVVRVLWDADADVPIFELAGDGHMCFESFGGVPNNAGAGVTGDIKFTTVGHDANDTYNIILDMAKL